MKFASEKASLAFIKVRLMTPKEFLFMIKSKESKK